VASGVIPGQRGSRSSRVALVSRGCAATMKLHGPIVVEVRGRDLEPTGSLDRTQVTPSDGATDGPLGDPEKRGRGSRGQKVGRRN
jgi:hypothetical protein